MIVARAVGRLDLAAQVGDVGPQHLDVVFVLDPPDLDQEGAVGHQAAAVAGQRPQQPELGRGQVNLLALAQHGAGGEVDLDSVGDDLRLGALGPSPAQNRLAGGRPARAGRTAWSRSRRRPPPAPRPFDPPRRPRRGRRSASRSTHAAAASPRRRRRRAASGRGSRPPAAARRPGRAPPRRRSPAPPRSRRRAGSPAGRAGSAARRRRRARAAPALTSRPPRQPGS